MLVLKSISLLLVGLSLAMIFRSQGAAQEIQLPAPELKGDVSVEEALNSRRTHRRFTDRSLTLPQLAQLLWAAYGVTKRRGGLGFKTAPSAGALYPLDIYAVAGDGTIGSLKAGVYHYQPDRHSLSPLKAGDLRQELARASLGQMWMAKAPLSLVITGEYRRSEVKYGRRSRIYVPIEAGCVGQNIFLQAEAQGLKAGIVGAFENSRIIETLNLPPQHDPLLVMPVGHIR